MKMICSKIRIISLTAFALSFLVLIAKAEDVSSPPAESESKVKTIICIRHGERLSDAQAQGHDYGQLTPQGLNRALALPKVLLEKFGKPQFIFAPNPAETIGSKDGSQYCYIRPLATIEPTAIFCELPVNTQFGFKDIRGLEAELRKPAYQNALIYVCWEHLWLERFVRLMVVNLGGNGEQVPVWDKSGMGYDGIYIIKITTANGQSSVAFAVDHEALDGLSREFPSAAVSFP